MFFCIIYSQRFHLIKIVLHGTFIPFFQNYDKIFCKLRMLVIKTLCLSLADEVLACTLPFVKTRPLRLAIAESRIKARNLVLPTLPPMERPKTCSALAKRLVSGALGLRLPTSSQDREKEKQLLKEARGNHSYNTGHYHQIHTQQNGILIIQFMKCHKKFLYKLYHCSMP